MPAVKITRAGIEVNEVPTDLSILEARVTATEAVNASQDTTIGVNDGNISLLQGAVTANATRLGDLVAVEAAVTALEALSHAEVSLVSVNAAITALQDASVSNAATIATVSATLGDLRTSNVVVAEAAIDALEVLVGGVTVTTLATSASVDLKVDDVSKSTFDTLFRTNVNSILTDGVLDVDNTDFSNLGTDIPYEEGKLYNFDYRIPVSNIFEKRSINMGFEIMNKSGSFHHYEGVVGLGSTGASTTLFSNQGLKQFNATVPFALTVGAAITQNKMDRDHKISSLFPEMSNVSFTQVVRRLNGPEAAYYEGLADPTTADLNLKPGQSIRPIKEYRMYTPDELAADDDLPTKDPRYPATLYNFAAGGSNAYVIVEPAEELRIEHALSQSVGFWTNRADVNSPAYKLRAHIEFERMKTIASSFTDVDLAPQYSMYPYTTSQPQAHQSTLADVPVVPSFLDTDEMYSLTVSRRLDAWLTNLAAIADVTDEFGVLVSGNEYILEAPHGVIQYDVAQFVATAAIEKAFNSPADYADDSNIKSAWDIFIDQVATPAGISMHGLIRNPGFHGLGGVYADQGYDHERMQWGSDVASVANNDINYGSHSGYTMGYGSYVGPTDLTGNYKNWYYNALCYGTVDNLMKLGMLVAERGVTAAGTRLIDADVMESLFVSRMTVGQPTTAAALDGRVDNCYGSLWRGVCGLGNPVRGPNTLPAEAYVYADLATDIDSLSFSSQPPSLSIGDLTTWAVATPPVRTITMPVSASTGNYMFIFPDSRTVGFIMSDDGSSLRLKEYKALTRELYNHIANNI
jgi:hypothetical protein